MRFSKKGKEMKNKTRQTHGSFSSVYRKSRQMDFALRNNGVTMFLKYRLEKIIVSFFNQNFYFRLVLEVQTNELGHENPHTQKR